MNQVVASCVLALILAGASFLMPKDEIVTQIFGYSLLLLAIVILGLSRSKYASYFGKPLPGIREYFHAYLYIAPFRWFRELIFDITRQTPPETIKKIRNRTIDFIEFCIAFRRQYTFEHRTTELSNQRVAFAKFLSEERPYRIKGFDKKAGDLRSKAVVLQRLLDSSRVSNPPADLDDKIDDIMDWFIEQRDEVNEIFNRHLK